jgi:hypothetical protein
MNRFNQAGGAMQEAHLNYFKNDRAPGLFFFECKKLHANLSIDACAESYKLAQKKESIEHGRRFTCRKCEIGRCHSGEKPASTIFGKPFCVRCFKHNGRLITHGICLSCYNRGLELKRGRNRRGTKPIFLKPLWHLKVAIKNNTNVSIAELEKVSNYAEIFLSILRKNDGQQFFGRPPLSSYKPRLQKLSGQAIGAPS